MCDLYHSRYNVAFTSMVQISLLVPVVLVSLHHMYCGEPPHVWHVSHFVKYCCYMLYCVAGTTDGRVSLYLVFHSFPGRLVVWFIPQSVGSVVGAACVTACLPNV